ncbi:MAG: hypothetical protein A3G41_03240 [Elusimicrobia bacterium RIFCSPLOWO2_12_FULL_59_9]|nr:MAG: hypothetical protein A3G41_03240 [Elusimicrobia bacterium RIFCSPLOWO2_12_FULL_59_9]
MPSETNAAGLSSFKIAPELLKLIPFETMRRHCLAPVDLNNGKLRLAMVRPKDLTAMDDIRILTGHELEIFPISAAELNEILRQNFMDLAEHPVYAALKLESAAPAAAGSPYPSDPNAVQSVERLFKLAVEMRASDIHLEPQRQGFYARFRVDGVLQTIHGFPKSSQAAMTSRIKVMANMDISEKRLPQDGQASLRHGNKNIDLRISTLPGKYGEKLVIRILDKSDLALGLERLGFEPGAQSVFESLIERSYGIILVTGPTGSGKTTTLYAVLNRLKSPLKNVITLEDPIEYELLAGNSNEMGITQVQVQPKIGLTFAAGLRSALRQDPDVIMVGEIRDKETAETAMKAAMTGHLVMSTLHTNDAPSALGRLMDMGIEPYLMASTIIGVLAQRLVRLLCPRCKEQYRPPVRALKNLFPNREDVSKAIFYRPIGCEHCQKTGYRGRQGIFELLTMTEELKQKTHCGEHLESLRKLVQSQGLKSLRESGMELVFQGLTTVEEISRVTVE